MSEKLTAAIEWLRKMGNTSHGIAVLDNDQRDALLAHLDGEKTRQDVAVSTALASQRASWKEEDARIGEEIRLKDARLIDQAARIAELESEQDYTVARMVKAEAEAKELRASFIDEHKAQSKAISMFVKAEAERDELKVDLDDSYRLRERLDTLLTGIADNLLGYDPNILHDWSRLPELIRQVREVGVTVVGEHPKTFAKNTRAEESEAVVKELKLENATKEREILRLLNVVCSAPACTAAVIRRDDGSRVCAAGHPARWVNIDLLIKAEEEIKELRSKLADAEHWKVKY